MEFNCRELFKNPGIVLLLVVGVLLRPESSFAQSIRIGGNYVEPPEPPKYGLYSETVEDMRVKVHGGYIRVVRDRKDKKWHINQRWAPVHRGSYATQSGVFSTVRTGRSSSGGIRVGVGGSTADDSNSDSPYLNRDGYAYINVDTRKRLSVLTTTVSIGLPAMMMVAYY